nr:hypothetical protein [Tanacetum cinerariifolium]
MRVVPRNYNPKGAMFLIASRFPTLPLACEFFIPGATVKESHETFQCQPMDQNIDFFGSDQIQTPHYPNVHHPSQEINLKELAKYVNSPSKDRPVFNNDEEHSDQNKEHLENYSNEIAASNSNQEKEKPPQDSDIQKQEVRNVVEQPAERKTHIIESLQNFKVIRKSSISLKNTSQISLVHAVAPIQSTEEPEYSSSMGLSKNEVTLEDKKECDVPVCENSPIRDDHFEIFSDSNNDDDISSDNDSFEDIDMNRLIANIESLNDNPTPDLVLNSFVSFLISEESDNSLSNNFCDHMEETRSGNTTTHANDSLPEYDSFCFEIKPNQERLINDVKNNIPDDSTNDPLLEEANLFLAFDNSIPPGIENFGDDSEGDIRFLEALISDDSIPFLNNESSESDFDNPSVPRPPPKQPDADFEPDSLNKISVVMNNNDKLECLNSKDKFYDDDYFSFMFVIYSKMFLSFLSVRMKILSLTLDYLDCEVFRALSFSFTRASHPQLQFVYFIVSEAWPMLKSSYKAGAGVIISRITSCRLAIDKIPACCDDDDDYNSTITPVLSTEKPDNSLSMGDEHLDTIPETESEMKSSVEDLVSIPSESEEVAEIVIPEDEEIEDDNLREKLLNVHLLIANIEALKDNPTPSSEFLTKSSSTSPISFLEETNTFENSLPEFENFYFDLEEISSGSTTTHSDISLLDYEDFYFHDDHIEEISSGSTTTHSDTSLFEYDSFIFDLLSDQFPPTDRSDFTHEEFTDELAHIISPPEYDCFYFRNLPDLGELISILNSGIRENLSSTTRVNLPVKDDHSPLLAYVVWIFLAYLMYPIIPPYLHSFGNEDTIFDPGITINRFYLFKPCLSHRCGTFKKFNTHRSHLNESPMEMLFSTYSPMDQ